MWKPYEIIKEFEITEFYSAFDRDCQEGFMFKGEYHNFWEFVYVIDGSIIVTADERIVNLSKNQILFHNPMEFHTQSVENGNSAHIFIMSFTAKGAFMDRFCKKIFQLNPELSKELMGILEFLKNYNKTNGVAPSPVAFLEKLSNDRAFAQKLRNLTENFLINISSAQPEENLVISNEAQIYRQAMNIIDNNIFKNLTVSEISEMCSVSESYLKKIFAKYVGIGIHSCVLKAKLNYAKQLLDSGMSVSRIAEKLSFSTANYFSVVFRRETGMSPLEYKRR